MRSQAPPPVPDPASLPMTVATSSARVNASVPPGNVYMPFPDVPTLPSPGVSPIQTARPPEPSAAPADPQPPRYYDDIFNRQPRQSNGANPAVAATFVLPPVAIALQPPFHVVQPVPVRATPPPPYSGNAPPQPQQQMPQKVLPTQRPAAAMGHPHSSAAAAAAGGDLHNIGVDELKRENALLTDRLRRFFCSELELAPTPAPGSSAAAEGMASGIDITVLPSNVLVARIRRLEAALRLECLAREDAELRCEAHRQAAIRLAQLQRPS